MDAEARADVCLVSNRRSRYMKYLVNECGMGQGTAALLYKCERLNAKGQTRQALFYLRNLLERRPGREQIASTERAHTTAVASFISHVNASHTANGCQLNDGLNEASVLQKYWVDRLSLSMGTSCLISDLTQFLCQLSLGHLDDAVPDSSESGCSSVLGQSSTKSAPVGLQTNHCLLPDSFILTESGEMVRVQNLQAGDALLSLCLDGFGITLGSTRVKAVRTMPVRDQDVAQIHGSVGDQDVCASMTNTHAVLSRAGRLLVSEQAPWKWNILAMSTDTSHLEDMEVHYVKRVVQSSEIIELELSDADCAVFMRSSADICVAVCGCPPQPQMIAEWRHGFLHVREDTGHDSVGRPASDPTYEVRQQRSIYRTIRRPHDQECTAWCKYHFTRECRHGKLCSRCHHFDHYQGRERPPHHRGKKRRKPRAQMEPSDHS